MVLRDGLAISNPHHPWDDLGLFRQDRSREMVRLWDTPVAEKNQRLAALEMTRTVGAKLQVVVRIVIKLLRLPSPRYDIYQVAVMGNIIIEARCDVLMAAIAMTWAVMTFGTGASYPQDLRVLRFTDPRPRQWTVHAAAAVNPVRKRG